MKKITSSLLTVFAMSSLVYGQNSAIKKMTPVAKKNINVIERKVSDNNLNNNLSSRAVIWSDDFGTPANWTIASTAGSGVWVIGTAVPNGSFPIDPIASTTAANGYGLFDSDLDCSGNQVANITTASPINCSAHPSVLLKFQQQYRRFHDSTFVFVSNNNTTWVKYAVNKALGNNDDSGVNPNNVVVNITPTAGGQATVYIRFQFYSPTSMGTAAGCGYSWMIDDVSIEDQPANDIVLSSVFYGEYSRIPDGQQMAITLGGGITNAGAAAQTAVTLHATVNTSLFTGTSAPVASLPIDQTDTVAITTDFTPGAIGNYVFGFAATQTETDANPADNITQNDTVKVTANTYARDNYKYTGDASWNGGDSYEMGNMFYFPTATNAVSVNFVISRTTRTGSIVSAKLYGSNLVDVKASSNPYTILASNKPTGIGYYPKSITLPFTAPVALEADSVYIAVIEFLNASGTDTVALAVGSDVFHPSQTSFLYDTPNSTWYTISSTPMVRLNVSNTLGINEFSSMNGTTLFQNQPNPFNKVSSINYEIEKSAAVSLNIYDVTGKKVAERNEGTQSSGKHVVNFNAENLSAGVYYYSLTVGENTTSSKKMVVIK